MDHTPDPERFNANETCARLAISRATLTRYIAAGRIAAMKIGGRTYIEAAEITDFFARERAEAARLRAARAKQHRGQRDAPEHIERRPRRLLPPVRHRPGEDDAA